MQIKLKLDTFLVSPKMNSQNTYFFRHVCTKMNSQNTYFFRHVCTKMNSQNTYFFRHVCSNHPVKTYML